MERHWAEGRVAAALQSAMQARQLLTENGDLPGQVDLARRRLVVLAEALITQLE